MHKNTAILVSACDGYKLLYKGFDYFFTKYWDHSIKLKKYFATELNDLEIEGYVNLKSGLGEWTNRLKIVLDQIEEDYIIFMQEDMWFNKPMPVGVLEEALDFSIQNNIDLLKLHSSEVYTTTPTQNSFKGFQLGKVDKENSEFLMSHQVSIWKKSFFYDQLKDNEHPWRNERKGSKRLKKSSADIFQLDLLSENSKPAINKNDDDAEQGDYQTISVNACIHPKAKPLIKELSTDLPEYAEKLMFHLENEITHNGMQKPRKVDIFKKIKTAIKSKLKK